MPHSLLNSILAQVNQYTERTSLANKSMINMPIVSRKIKWNLPKDDWVALNADGAILNSGKVGCRGVLKDKNGEWLANFSKNLRRCSVIVVEL